MRTSIVPGTPIGEGRPRVSTSAGRARTKILIAEDRHDRTTHAEKAAVQ